MKKMRTQWSGWSFWILGAVFVAASIVLLIGVIGTDPQHLYGQVTAAWVQAIGSVAAIIGASWIARHESREAVEREAREFKRERLALLTDERDALGAAQGCILFACRNIETFKARLVPGASRDVVGKVARSAIELSAAAIARVPVHELRPLPAPQLFWRCEAAIQALLQQIGDLERHLSIEVKPSRILSNLQVANLLEIVRVTELALKEADSVFTDLLANGSAEIGRVSTTEPMALSMI